MLHVFVVSVCHAELNAVLNKYSADVKNCTIYTALFPCYECAKVIIQSGIKEVVYYSDKYMMTKKTRASKIILRRAGVACRYDQKGKVILTDFIVCNMSL